METKSKLFKYDLVDAYNEKNIDNHIIKSLPVYLYIEFTVESEFELVIKNPKNNVIETLTDSGYSNYSNTWKIEIKEEPGEWTLEAKFYSKQRKFNEEKLKINFKITNELFEEYYDKLDELTEQGAAIDYLQELESTMSSTKEIKNITSDSQEENISAHWLELNKELKLYRFINEDTESEKDLNLNYIPILLAHGFDSNHKTWNWMSRYLWLDGFKYIFAFTMQNDRQKLRVMTKNLADVINAILEICNARHVYIIAHSLGGLLSRYYVKHYDFTKVKLLVTISSGHFGVNKALSRVLVYIKKAKELELELNSDKNSGVNQLARIQTEGDLYALTMVNICGTKIMGGDGMFKAIQVPDMINYEVNGHHTETNKIPETYYLIQGLLFRQFSIFKIRLLYITVLEPINKNEKVYLNFKSEQSLKMQIYPHEGFLELTNENFVPTEPLIVFSNFSKNKTSEKVEIQILNQQKKIICQEEKIIAISSKEPVTDLFFIEFKKKFKLQFAVYSHFFEYD